MTDDLELSTRVEVTDDQLQIHYSVTNGAGLDAYLLNRVHDQSLQTHPDLVYIQFDRPRRTAWIYKKIPRIPEGMNPTMPAHPYVTPVRSGTTFSETVRLEMPVREFSAYLPVPETGRTVRYEALRFALDYYWSVPGMEEVEMEIVPGVQVLVPRAPVGSQIEVKELRSRVIQVEFPAIETD